ncbi:hypothetical protein KAR91_86310 [Candidatus Pacearchaeota archaeon]|nr:hypothetical protein [Candidatus Pacearchaeota archaeon]
MAKSKDKVESDYYFMPDPDPEFKFGEKSIFFKMHCPPIKLDREYIGENYIVQFKKEPGYLYFRFIPTNRISEQFNNVLFKMFER